jgi:pimeloyl-ACP methyl ester carboxylesterase
VESFRTADGRRLAYRRDGEGPLLVCHGGGPGFSARHLADLGGLTERLTLLLLDPRGTGGSDRPADPRAYTIEDYVSDVEELRVHLGLERIDLFGSSHGGVVAQAYAAAHPGRVERLVLACTLPRFATEQESAMEEALAARAGEPWYEDARAALEAEQRGEFTTDEELGELAVRELPFYFAHYGEREAAYVERYFGDPANADTLLLFNREIFPVFDLRPMLPSITARTLILVGVDDFICGTASAAELQARIPAARTVVLEDCGHFLWVEQPEAFRRAIFELLLEG